MSTPYTVVIADDHSLYREGVKAALGNEFQVIGEAENGKKAVEEAMAVKPDILLLDWHMPEMDGLQAAKEVRRFLPDVKIVFLTMSEDQQDMARALEERSAAYISKTANSQCINDTLRLVMNGEVVFPAKAYEKAPAMAGADEIERALTAREVEILSCLGNGMSNKEIANTLGVAEGTIKVHIKSILKKLEVDNRTQAGILAYENGYVYNKK